MTPFRRRWLTASVTLHSHRLALPAALGILSGLLVSSPRPAAAGELGVEDAIRAAWARNPGLQASAEAVHAARADAARARDARLPTLSVTLRAARTDEPMMAFGTRLDQARIGQADFDPARLNHPDAIGAAGAGVTLTLPLFMGGRLVAGQRAATGLAAPRAQNRSQPPRQRSILL